MRTKPPTLEIYRFSEAERSQIAAAYETFTYKPETALAETLADAHARLRAGAPMRAVQLLGQRGEDRPAAVLFENLPYDDSIRYGLKTPEIAIAPKPSRLSEGLLLGAARFCGLPYGVTSEGQGLVSNLCPVQSHAQSLTGLGSKRTLGLHIENSALRRARKGTAPDGLILIGITGEPGGSPATLIADARQAKALAGASCEKVLREDRFLLRLPERWRRPGHAEYVKAPIIVGYGAEESFAFAFYGDMVEAVDREAAVQLEVFRQALHEVEIAVQIEPGVMLLVDNRIAAHGRTAFRSSFTADGAPYRWLQRIFWASEFERFSEWAERRPAVFEPLADSLLS